MTDLSLWLDATFAGFDYALLQALHHLAEWGGAVLTPLFTAVSFVGEYGAAILLLALIFLLSHKTRRVGMCILVAVCVGALFTNVVLKDLIARPRPFADVWSEYYLWWQAVGANSAVGFSFPSGHVTAAMAGMTALFLTTNKRIAWIGFLFVIVMALSRCYLMVHYPTDTLAAMLVGAAAGVSAYFLIGRKARDVKHEHIVSIDSQSCVGCGLCCKDCVSQVLVLSSGKAEVATQSCIKCGHCVAICPQGAVSISGFEDAPEALIKNKRVDSSALMHQLKARRSMRQFTQQEVPQELIELLIEAGRYTPTGTNRQGVSYVVLKNNIDEYEALALKFIRRANKVLSLVKSEYRHMRVDDNFLFKKAPVALVIKSSNMVDGALAASSMELMAQSLGLGVFYSGFFSIAARSVGKLKKKLGVARGEKVVTTLVLGYPAVSYQRTAPREKPSVIFD